LKDAKIDLEILVLERKSINDNLKMRGLTPANHTTLTINKTTIVTKEKQLQSKWIKLEKDVQQLRAASFMATKKIETDVHKVEGRREKALQNGLEQHICKNVLVTVSPYHGRDMEGNSIRCLMGQGTKIFEEVATFVKGWLIIAIVGSQRF
jgi:hypothetical protein